jgi:hypothetical protein
VTDGLYRFAPFVYEQEGRRRLPFFTSDAHITPKDIGIENPKPAIAPNSQKTLADRLSERGMLAHYQPTDL